MQNRPCPVLRFAARNRPEFALRAQTPRNQCGIRNEELELLKSDSASPPPRVLPPVRNNGFGSIGDLPNSNLWFGKSCSAARQQVEAAQRPPRQRRTTDLALSETCQTPICGLASRAVLRGSKRKQAQPAGIAAIFYMKVRLFACILRAPDV